MWSPEIDAEWQSLTERTQALTQGAAVSIKERMSGAWIIVRRQVEGRACLRPPSR